jgi:hypothetical protein
MTDIAPDKAAEYKRIADEFSEHLRAVELEVAADIERDRLLPESVKAVQRRNLLRWLDRVPPMTSDAAAV